MLFTEIISSISIRRWLKILVLRSVLIAPILTTVILFLSNILSGYILKFKIVLIILICCIVLVFLCYFIVFCVRFLKKLKRYKRLGKQWNIPYHMVCYGLYTLKLLAEDHLVKLEDQSCEWFLEEFRYNADFLEVKIPAEYKKILGNK
jgi:hypothetical protein